MGNPTGFLEIDKKERNYEDPKDRLKHFKEFIVPLTNEEVSSSKLAFLKTFIKDLSLANS